MRRDPWQHSVAVTCYKHVEFKRSLHEGSVKLRSPVIIHVPHSSRLIPREFRDQFRVSDGELELIHEAMVDHDTHLMLGSEMNVVRFPYSRLLVDVERFWSGEHEPMESIGMGALYSVDHTLRPIRRELSNDEVSDLREIYDEHHRRLGDACLDALQEYGRCVILDLHSYPFTRQPYEQNYGARPQLCVGTDSFHTPQWLFRIVSQLAHENGFEVGENSPFEGSMVPLASFWVRQKGFVCDAGVAPRHLSGRRSHGSGSD